MDQKAPPTAVAVDEWPLVRLGIMQALRAVGISVVAEVGHGHEGLRAVEKARAGFLLLGNHRDLPLPETARRAKALASPPKVLVLVDQIDRNDLLALRTVGIDALLPRSVGAVELGLAIKQVALGERVVAPALLSLLVGVLGPAGAAGDHGNRGSRAPTRDAEPLTRKELEVLARLAEGRSNREIAEALFVTQATVKSHLAHIYVKLGVAGRQAAMARAVALGLLG